MSVADKASVKRRIPKFHTYEEEAEFWDRHSPEEFPDEFEDIEVTLATSGLRDRAESENRRKLIAALSDLSELERQTTALLLLGLTESEIARILGVTAQQLNRATSRARRRIAELALAEVD